MTRLDFVLIGEALYGANWKSDVARDLQMNVRTIRRFATGEYHLTEDVALKAKNLLADRLGELTGLLARLK